MKDMKSATKGGIYNKYDKSRQVLGGSSLEWRDNANPKLPVLHRNYDLIGRFFRTTNLSLHALPILTEHYEVDENSHSVGK